jgi:hypothetical protein
LSGFSERLDNFFKEFSRIKSENESTAIAYLDKIKELIEEGEAHVKDIDSKIPKDLKSMKEDLRQRYSKLKFMINEYYEHYNTTSDNRKLSKYYLDKSAQTLKRLTNLHLRTDEEAELKKLEDEK